jgi:acyl dehydratase
MRHIDDIQVGERFELGTHTFTADAIKDFARRFDPQAFHVDEAAAARSHFGRLCASGWHTTSVWMRLLVAHRAREDAALRAAGKPVAEVGPALGFRDLTWTRPVYAGDAIAYSAEVSETRLSVSRPGWGLLSVRAAGVNQDGAAVIAFSVTAFVEARSALA